MALRLYAPAGVSMSWIWIAAGAALLVAGGLSLTSLPRLPRLVWRVLLGLGLAGALALTCVVATGMRAKLPDNVDAIVVLGARVHEDGHFSMALEHRVDAAYDYLVRNENTICIVSGGKGADEPVAEARAMREALLDRGIAPSRVIAEERSTDTRENLIYSRALLPEGAKTVGIVTNNFHVARALLLARQLGYNDPKGLAASFTGLALPHFMVREDIGLLYELIRNRIK